MGQGTRLSVVTMLAREVRPMPRRDRKFLEAVKRMRREPFNATPRLVKKAGRNG